MEAVLEPLDEQQLPSAAEPADTVAAAPPAAPEEPVKRPRGHPKRSVNEPKLPVKRPSPKAKKQKRPPSTSSEFLTQTNRHGRTRALPSIN